MWLQESRLRQLNLETRVSLDRLNSLETVTRPEVLWLDANYLTDIEEDMVQCEADSTTSLPGVKDLVSFTLFLQ